jgi:hypothetical protein
MGSSRWDPKAYAGYTDSIRGKTTAGVFATGASTVSSTGTIVDRLNPKGVTMRESRDSDVHPLSTAIIVALDQTGSMGMIAHSIAREGLGVLFDEILKRKPVTDPHLMFMALGDANCDAFPLQVSQFEAGPEIIEQLSEIFLEGAGGGNSFESYNLPWYFAAFHTSIDCIEKRGKRGYLFTVGDELSPDDLTVEQIKTVIGDTPERAYTNEELLTLVQRMYHVYHVIIEEGSYARHNADHVNENWVNVLGQNVIRLKDHTKLSEVIISAIQIAEGADRDAIVRSWDGKTKDVVAHATAGLPATGTDGPGFVRL